MKEYKFTHFGVIFFALILCLTSCTKKITALIPTWDQGQSYSYKLTYTIKSPEVSKDRTGPNQVEVYQTMNVISESPSSWIVNLTFDRLVKDEQIWDQDAEYRFFPNQLSYEIFVPKNPSKEISVINSEPIYGQIVEYLKDKLEPDALKELIKETKVNGGIESLVLKDFGFLFLNNYKSIKYDIPMVRDTMYNKKQSKQTESYAFDKDRKQVLFSSEAIERFTPNIDTIAPFIYKYRESISTTKQTISYDTEANPVFSKIIVHLLDGGANVTRVDKDHNTILSGGSITETVTVELLSVKGGQ